MRAENAPPITAGPRAFNAIFYGGLTVGILDGLDALIFFSLRGVRPSGIFQYIASGLLGPAAFRGGAMTTALGVLLHFVVAFIVATIYYGASRRFPFLLRQAVWCGLLYGVTVYFVMQYIIVPLSAAPQTALSLPSLLNGIIGHALLVGLPVALLARRAARLR